MRIEGNGRRQVPAVVGKTTRPTPAHWEPEARPDTSAALLAETRKTNSLLTRLLGMIESYMEGE